MNDIMDLIYQIFDEIKEAKLKNDEKRVEEKEKELDKLRVQLIHSSNRRGIAKNLLNFKSEN